MVNDFETVRSTATAWARTYFQAGEAFNYADQAETQQRASWEGMKAARRRLIAVAQRRAARDTRRLSHSHVHHGSDDGQPIGEGGQHLCTAVRTSMQAPGTHRHERVSSLESPLCTRVRTSVQRTSEIDTEQGPYV